ncbi:hypothetical protein WOLCODRAFT_163608 [Wolfiporia cocos MD-104 SS10]|uniref:Uncharacterized protein n=1 Tax=Wolfiporia cocos (strain MD-104) TaxID=742152 RepID=A0A2H3JQN4_WOLCO|nr:hypothetical protein WOLCODRAFT_163608 [Wolfiporia cocos MD-104 SS10]
MGTQGCKVIRHKNRYVTIYEHSKPSYPSGLRVDILFDIPTDPAEFQQWIDDLRLWAEECFATWDKAKPGERVEIEAEVSWRQSIDLLPRWVYELDLDNLIFHVDCAPLFRLDHLPPPELFCEFISKDSYGHRAYHSETPEEYRYNWTAPPPPVDESALSGYTGYAPTCVQLDDLIPVTPQMAVSHTVRVRLVEVCIGHFISMYGTTPLRKLEDIQSRSKMSREDLALALTFVRIGLTSLLLVPPRRPKSARSNYERHIGRGIHTPPPDIPSRSPLPQGEFWWPQRDLCVRICTHLDDASNLQAAVSQTVKEILHADNGCSVTYGLAFSVFHCVIIRVSKPSQEGSSPVVKHTPALQFAPSYCADSPSTSGITAFALLAQTISFDVRSTLRAYLGDHYIEPEMLPQDDRLARLPPELRENIAGFLVSAKHLAHFAMSSQQALEAVTPHLRRPFVATYPLLTVVPTSAGDVRSRMLLRSGYFKIIRGDTEDTLRLGLAYHLAAQISRNAGCVAMPHFQGLAGEFRPEIVFELIVRCTLFRGVKLMEITRRRNSPCSSNLTCLWHVSAPDSLTRIVQCSGMLPSE